MIAQLVERRTVVCTQLDILRSLVRLRFAGSQLSFSLQESILHGRSNIITNTSMGGLRLDYGGLARFYSTYVNLQFLFCLLTFL